MGLGSLINRLVPTAIGAVTGGGLGAITAFAANEKALDEQKKVERQINQQINQRKEQERFFNMIETIPRGLSSNKSSTVNSGFGSGFGNFLTEASTNILSPLGTFASGISSLFGLGTRPQNVSQQPAVTTVTNVGAQETQGSGTNEAFIGGFPSLIGNLGKIIRSPVVSGTGIGTAIGGALSLFDGTGKPLRVTRKMKRLAQQAYQLAMMDLGTAIQLFAQLSGVQVDQRTFVLILTKRFRNDGPVVTKAALRKTRTTIRRMKNMCDMFDSLRPRATRRAPMRRATTSRTTLIKN